MLRFAFSILFAAALVRAEIIDRVAVIVGDAVITESEITRQIRITAFLNGEKPDFSPESKRTAADRLVEQALIRKEIEASKFTQATVPEYEPAFEVFRKSRYASDAAYAQALAAYGITDADVKEHFQWQTTLLKFIDIRFRPGVQVPDADVQDYYQHQFLVEWTRTNKGAPPPPLEEARDDIEKILSSQRTDNALDRWLGQARTQTRIVYRDEAFR
jgi:hypothetical protein